MIHRDGQDTGLSLNEVGALIDRHGSRYTAAFDGKHVIMTDRDGKKFRARWKLDGGELRDISGTGALHHFRFTFFDYGRGNQRLHSLWTFNGSSANAIDALKRAGYSPAVWDNRFNRSSESSCAVPLFHMRSRGRLLTGADSGHAILHLDRSQKSALASGELHVGEHNPLHTIGFFLHQWECR